MLKYMQAFHAVALKLMRAFALALKLPINFFDDVRRFCVHQHLRFSYVHQLGLLAHCCAQNSWQSLLMGMA